jgi:septal ring factor EnvC (AmiA/AmiB activator)
MVYDKLKEFNESLKKINEQLNIKNDDYISLKIDRIEKAKSYNNAVIAMFFSLVCFLGVSVFVHFLTIYHLAFLFLYLASRAESKKIGRQIEQIDKDIWNTYNDICNLNDKEDELNIKIAALKSEKKDIKGEFKYSYKGETVKNINNVSKAKSYKKEKR